MKWPVNWYTVLKEVVGLFFRSPSTFEKRPLLSTFMRGLGSRKLRSIYDSFSCLACRPINIDLRQKLLAARDNNALNLIVDIVKSA